MTEIERMDNIVLLTQLEPGRSAHIKMSMQEISVNWAHYVNPYGTSPYLLTVAEHKRGGCIVNVSLKRSN